MAEFSSRRVSGHFTEVGWAGELVNGQTVSCVHCQHTWIVRKGSGRLRGFCQNCMGYVCGPACAACVHFERRVENIEAGLPADTPGPILVSVPAQIEAVSGFNTGG